MISQRELQRRIKNLELKSCDQQRTFVYSARDGDIDSDRTATIERRCEEEFGFDIRNGDIFIELIEFEWDDEKEICSDFRHDFILKIDGEDYNEGWNLNN